MSEAAREKRKTQAVEQIARFSKAARGELSADETRAAWHDFAEMFARVARRGPVWDAETTPMLAAAVVTIDLDATERDKAFEATEACGDDKRQARRVRTPHASLPPIEIVDKLTVALGVDGDSADDGRRLAGFLPKAIQGGGE